MNCCTACDVNGEYCGECLENFELIDKICVVFEAGDDNGDYDPEELNLYIIIGLCVFVVLVIITAIIIAIVCLKKKRKQVAADKGDTEI